MTTAAGANTLPSTTPIDFTQAQTVAAEAEAKPTPNDERVFKLGRKSWPLVPSVSFVRAANIQKSLTDFDLLEIAAQLPSLVFENHREELRDYLLADTDHTDADHITMSDVIDAWSSVQEVLAARPLAK